jgi:enoyl-CoA hydratase
MATVRIDQLDRHVRGITLDRPEQLNALSFEAVGDLHAALDTIAADADCKVVVLTGAGRGFCAGLDLRDFGTPPGPGEHPHAGVGVSGQEFIANLVVRLRRTPQIVIAAVNGPAFGGGLSLACGADIRVASEDARFCSAFIRTGLSGTDCGISVLLPQIVGAGRAFELIASGRAIDADEAERIGLVTAVVPPEHLLDDVLERARTIAGYTTIGLVLTKEAFWHNVGIADITAAVALENRNQRLAAESPEVQEYMREYSRRHKK